jgi:phosphate transport system ATP-binding protein
MTAIQAIDLSVRYGPFEALCRVNAAIPHRAVTALIGPSGCGKSTFLRSIDRLNERYAGVTTSGRLHVFGKNVYDADVSLGELRRKVGMVFQRPNPMPLSVYENVAFGLRVHSPRGALSRAGVDAQVEQALRDVQLWDEVRGRLRSSALALSLAAQQRLCIARLLPLKPEVILMDEPCSALDAADTAAIEALIRRLRDDYTVVIVTHNMAQARRTSDHCIFMLLGRVVEQGTTADVFGHPASEETQRYVAGLYG